MGKAVICVETGEAFKSEKEAALYLGAAPESVSRAIKNPLYTVCGYHFDFLERGDPEEYIPCKDVEITIRVRNRTEFVIDIH